MEISCVSIAAVQSLSRFVLFLTPWTVACQAPLSMGFSWQEYWNGLPFPSPGHLPNPGIKPASPALAGRFFTTNPPGKPIVDGFRYINPGGGKLLYIY